jgi:hypothetical protein
MQIELFPAEEALPLLSDMEAGAEFLYENGLYIKHQKNGAKHFKVYLLNNKAWKTLPGDVQVRRVTIICTAKRL